MSSVILQPQLIGTVQSTKFDFSSLLAAGETISTKSVAASVYSGTDTAPSGVVSGSASSSGAVVSQLITLVGKTAGVVYELLCTITTSAGQTLKLSAFLASVSDLP